MPVADPETAAAHRTAGASGLRLLPAPVSAPPYDDELPPGPRLRLVPAGQGGPRHVVPPLAPVAPLRLVPSPPPAPPGASPHDADDDRPRRTPLAELPPARAFAQALVQRLLEVQAGLRPLGQLQRDTTLELYDELAGTLGTRPRPSGPRPTRRDVRSLHVQEREDGVADVCATVRRGDRVTALAFRLEGRAGAWRCTELLGV